MKFLWRAFQARRARGVRDSATKSRLPARALPDRRWGGFHDHDHGRLAAERLEGRALLAVTATLSGGDLLISSTAAGDVLAEIASDGTNYTVSGTGLSATTFPIASVTGKISVGDPIGVDGQTFRVAAGTALANPLQVTASIETTELLAGINATVAGDISIYSASVTTGFEPVSVSTSATNGNVWLSGAVTLRNDASFTSGSGTITIGSVTGASAQAITLGDTNQSGQVTITGNVSLPNGVLMSAAGAFGLSLAGAANSVAYSLIENSGVLRIGQAGGTSTFRGGLSANRASAISVAGVVETVNSALRLGSVALLADTTLRSGSGVIVTGAVTDGMSSRTLTLGSLTQTGEITLGGSVTIDGLATAAGNFAVSLRGASNAIDQQVSFTNTKYVVFGDETGDTSLFYGGVTATSQTASNVLIGTVRTAGGTIDISGAYLAGVTTLDTSNAGSVAAGASITLRNGVSLAGQVLTTIGGVGATAAGTYLLGTGGFGGGSSDPGSLVVQNGSLFIGDGPTKVAALTVPSDTTIEVTAGGLTVGAGSTIDATGKTLTLLGDDVTIASAAGSIDAGRITLAPVTAGRNIFLGTAAGTGLVLDTAEIQAIDADTIQIGKTGYTGRVTVGTLSLADTTLAIVADGTGGGVTLDGAFTGTGSLPGSMGLEITGSGAGTVLNGNITSTGYVFIDDAVELAANVTIDTSAGGSDVYITGGSTGIWSSKGEANDLVARAGAGSAILGTRAGLNDHGGAADLVRNVTLTGDSVLLGSGNVISGGLSLGGTQVTLGAVVRAAGAISIDNGAGGEAAIVITSSTILDATQDGKAAAGNPVTIRGTVTALAATNNLFSLKGGTGGDVLVTGRVGVVGNGSALGTVSITGNDLTVAAIDGLSQGLFLEGVDGMGGADPGSVTLTGTTYQSTTSLGISAGSRDPVTNALGSAQNRITLAGGAAGTTTSFVTSGFDAEFSGNVDLAGRNMSVDTTSGGTATRSGLIWIYDAVDGAGTLTLDAGSGGNILVNHLTGETGATTPLMGVTVVNGYDVGFFKDVSAGTVRIIDTTREVTFAGVLTITGGFVAEAQPYAIRMLGGDLGSSRIAGVTTFHNMGLLAFGNQGPSDRFTFAGGLVATAPSEVRLTASVLADSGSIVLGDADTDVTIAGATIGGAATAITLADVVLDTNGGLIIGTGLANTVQVGSVIGTVTGFADALTINTAGAVTITGSVGSGVDQFTVTKSGGATFQAAVAAGTVTLTDTTGTITFQGDLTATTLITAANGYSVAFQGAATTVAGNTVFLNTGTVSFGNDASDISTFTAGLFTSGGPRTTLIAGTLASSGNVMLGETTLLTNVTFSGPLISFGGTLTGGSFGLTTSDPLASDGGDAAFAEAVTVGSLSVFGTTTIAGPSVTTVGTQTYTQQVTITAPSVVLRGAGGMASRITTVVGTDVELDFDDGFTLPETTWPFSDIRGTLTVSDGVLFGSVLVSNLALTPAATFQVSLPLGPYGWGQIQVAGSSSVTVNLGSAALSLTGSAPLPLGTTLRIIDNYSTVPVTGTFAGLPEGALFDSPLGVCRISYVGGDGNDVTVEAVSRDNVVSLEDGYLIMNLAGTGTTVRNLSTQYRAASRQLVLTALTDRPLTGGGTGLTVNPRAGTVTVSLAQVPTFRGIIVAGTGATDRITLGPRGVNLAALTAGDASQAFVINTGLGVDVVTVRSPVSTKGTDGGFVVEAATINLGTAISTGFGQQRYRGHVTLVSDTSLTGGEIRFDTKVDGAQRLTLNASGRVSFDDSIGGLTPLKGITIQRAASFEATMGLRLDGRGAGSTANGLVIGRGVGSVAIGTEDQETRPITISNFGGSGILFQGGSQGSVIGRATLAGNGQGITFLPGDYTGTTVVSNAILRSKRAGIVLDGARNVWIGDDVFSSANLIQGGAVARLSGKGILAKGLLTGTRIIGNTIERNNGGIVLQDAKGLTVGGTALIGGAARANTITGNTAWGLLGSGDCIGSVIDANTISGNTPGDVNVLRARGLVVVPPG